MFCQIKMLQICAPKRVKTPKGSKSGPYEIFLFSRWRYSEIMGTDQIWSDTGLKFSLLQNPYFRAEIGNSDDSSPKISSRQQNLPSLKSDLHPVSKLWASVFLVPKMGQCPKSTMPISQILLGAYAAVGEPTVSWNLGQIHQANLLWEPVEIWGPKFQQAQKRELVPKKIQWVEGNIVLLKFTQKNFQHRPSAHLAKHWFDTIHRISIYMQSNLSGK